MGDSPAVIIYGSNGIGGFEEKGKQHPFKIDGYGTAGLPVGGVVSIQGVSGGQAVPVSGTFAAAVIPNDTDVTGTITATNGTVTKAVQGYQSCGVVISGTWASILVFEISPDGGTTWASGAFIIPPKSVFPLPGFACVITANGVYPCIGLGVQTHIRVRSAAHYSGTVNVRIVVGAAPPAILTTFAAVHQNISDSLYNNSTTNLAVGASFTGVSESSLGINSVRVHVKSSQPIIVNLAQGNDGANWDSYEENTFLGEQGDGRVFQITSSYFRVVATNVGNATTSYFRLLTTLCPVGMVLPNSLTPHGKLQIAAQTVDWAPNPVNFMDTESKRALLMDVDRNLNVRARCLTDELSFRDDFVGVTPYTDCTGTFHFTNGSTIVTGIGTLFMTELNIQQYIKISGHADTVYAPIVEILSDTYLLLDENYSGATASGTGRSSDWEYSIGTGGAITQTGSEILLASGTTSGSRIYANRRGDYPPYVIGFKARVTQRIANQTITIGLGDAAYDTANNQASLVFDGTTNTTIKLRTSSSAADIETTTATIPDGYVSSTAIFYQLEVTASKVTLFCNDVRLIEHRLHIPGPYAAMDCKIQIHNTGTAGSTTTLALDMYYLTNFDRVEIVNSTKGDQLAVKEMRASSSTTTSVVAAVASTQLLAPNLNRLSYSVYNDSVATLYLKHGSGASLTSFKVALSRYDYYECIGYTGRVNGYWSAATGSARVSEET